MLKIHNLLVILKNVNKHIKTISIVRNTKINQKILKLLWKSNIILGYSTLSNTNYLKIWHIKKPFFSIQAPNQKHKQKLFMNKKKLIFFINKQTYNLIVYTNQYGFCLNQLIKNNYLGGKLLW